MIVGILVSLFAIVSIRLVSVLNSRHRWPFRLWTVILGLALLAVRGVMGSRVSPSHAEIDTCVQ